MAVAAHVFPGAPTPGHSTKATEFIRWAIAEYGQPSSHDPSQVVITRSQHELTLAAGLASKSGTVAWYLRQLRAGGAVTHTRPIIVDLDALDSLVVDAPAPPDTQPWGGAPAPSGRARLRSVPTPRRGGGGGEGPRSPSAGDVPADVRDLLAEQAHLFAELAAAQAQQAQVMAALAANQARLLELLTRESEPATSRGNRESASDPVAVSATGRGNREFLPTEGREEEGVISPAQNNDQPPTSSLPDRETANRGPRTGRDNPREPATIRGPRTRPQQSGGTAGQTGPRGPRLPLAHVREVLEPLVELCRTTGRPTDINRNGLTALAGLDRTALEAEVANLYREAASDLTIRRPLGLIVHRARQHVADTTDTAPTATPDDVGHVELWPSTSPDPPADTRQDRVVDVDRAAAALAAVDALETDPTRADELAALDRAAEAALAASGLTDALATRTRADPVAWRNHRARAYAGLTAAESSEREMEP